MHFKSVTVLLYPTYVRKQYRMHSLTADALASTTHALWPSVMGCASNASPAQPAALPPVLVFVG